jgi:hypothetical protein
MTILGGWHAKGSRRKDQEAGVEAACPRQGVGGG